VANTLGSLVYHLAKNPEAMEILEREVEDTLAAFDGRVDHETIADMPYLDGCVRETLRYSKEKIRKMINFCLSELRQYKKQTVPLRNLEGTILHRE
jgi:hypothetical protein